MAIDIRKLRFEIRDHLMERHTLEEHTADNIADNARFDYLVCECCFYENGDRIFQDIDDYNNKSADVVAVSAASLLADLLYGINDGVEQKLPENIWLKKFNLVDDKLSLINKEGHLVDLQNRLINESGHYIDDEGKRVDIDGNLLNEDGTYVISAIYEDDMEPKKKKIAK